MKYQIVKQHNEEDCGAASLATISKHYGKIFTISRCREVVGTGQQGTTLLGIKQGAEALGFNARAVKATLEAIDSQTIPLPAMIHWKGYHWVVLYGKKGKKYVVADPGIGIRYLDRQSLSESWSGGVMLILEPDPVSFYEQIDDRDKIGGIGRFLRRVLPYKGIIIQSFILNVFLGLLSLAFPLLMQILTDDVLVRGDTQLLGRMVIAVGVMYLISSFLGLAQSNLIAHFSQRLQLGLIFDFGRKILGLPLDYYESRRSGEVVSRLEDIQEINQLISQGVILLPSQFFIAIISLCFMLSYSVSLSAVAGIIAIVMTFSTIVFLPSLQRKIRNVLILSAENQGILVETFKGAITLKTTTSAPQFWEEFQHRYSRLANITLGMIQIIFVNKTFSDFVANLGTLILLWFGSRLVIDNQLTIGMLLAFNSMNGNFNNFIKTSLDFVDEFTRAKTSLQRLSEVIEATPENPAGMQKPEVQIPDNADIICDRLDFHHSGRIDLLENFSVTIPGGKVTALIGKSGCGKSTLAKIIANLYVPQSGNVRFGQYNQDDLDLDCLRQQVVLVPQDAHFWSRSILENFRLGNPNLSFEQIVTACRVTGADEFISKLPDKYQTILGEFGSNLSGGQKQRLALARGIFAAKESDLILLDEPTSSVDPKTELKIYDQLFEAFADKAILSSLHRLHLLPKFDYIYIMDQGKIIDQGTFQHLYQKSETFQAMWAHQEEVVG